MTAPPFRAVNQHTGDIAPGVDQSMLTGFADIDRLQTDLAKARADAEELRELLASANRHNASLSATIDRYGLEILDLRDSRDELAVRRDELSAEVDRLGEAVLEARADRDAARYERDTANARASL